MKGREEELIQAAYRYALALTHGSQEAEDLVHEGWLRLRRGGYWWIRKPLLFRTVRNLFVDRYRREQILPLDSLDEQVHEFPATSAPIEIEVTRAELETALGGLRAGEREALYLNAVEGYTAKEISSLTERPRNTVLSLIHRARRRMQQQLEQSPEQAKKPSTMEGGETRAGDAGRRDEE